MKKLTLIILLVTCCLANAQTPTFCWGSGSSTNGGHDEGTNVATDALGNVYLTGQVQSTSVIFGTYTLTTSGMGEVFLIKFNPAGAVVWARSSTNSGGKGNSVAIDTTGNIYVTGTFNSSITFGSFSLNNGGVFIVKYDANGNEVWAKSAGGINDGGNDVTTDLSGNVYITGSFWSPSITFGTNTLVNSGGSTPYDLFLAKYDASGNPLWAITAGGSNSIGDFGYAVDTDLSGNIFITGYLGSTTATFGSYSVNGPGFFLVKYDGTGNALWAKYNANNDEGKKVATDVFGNIYVRTDNDLIKYNSSGNVNWIKTFPGIGYCVDTDLNGNVYLTGSAGGGGNTFTIGTYTFSFASYMPRDPMYVAKCDSSGNVLCAAALSSGGDDRQGLATDRFGNAYIGGDYETVPFIIGYDTLPTRADENLFVAKFSCENCAQQNTINESRNKKNIFVFPNPATNKINLQSQTEIGLLTIYNSLGEMVYKLEISNQNSEIDISNLSRGIYILNTPGKHVRLVKE